MLENVVKAYAHMLRGPYSHVVLVAVGGVKVHNVYRRWGCVDSFATLPQRGKFFHRESGGSPDSAL